MQVINEGQDFDVYVDFAHTPAALEAVLRNLKTIAEDKLIAVFGSAGERDKEKREMMGRVGTKFADYSIFTGEDPRSEDVTTIIEQSARGASKVGGVEGRTFFKIADRAEAINYAIQSLAGTNDIVAIFGKGHEKSINIRGTEYPWSDQEAARNALKSRAKK
jgi:UDP-N-acetylmuramoyl-L-alanyl-D-glutamate--2,6-diaminopimelate ligase